MSEKLYNFLSEQGDYSKSYEDFQAQFASQDSIQRLHNFMSEQDYYSKSLDDFNTQFFSGETNGSSLKQPKVDPGDIAREKLVETAPTFMKPAAYASNFLNIIKDLVTDKEEREETAETVSGAFALKPRLLRTALQIQKGIVDLTTADLDNLGYNKKQREIRDKAEVFMKEKYKEIDIIQKYLIKDTGEGIVKGIKQGDASDFIGGIVNANTSMVETVVPAMLTGGVSLPFQIIAPMYSDYNEAKAKAIYGEDDPNAMDKLIDNDQTELAIPATLGLLASSLEYVGFRGIAKYMASMGGKGTTAAKLLLTANKEGLTEWGQGGIEAANLAFGEGKDGIEAGKALVNNMFSEAGVESYLNGFIGGAGMSAAGSAVNRALRSDNVSVKELNSKINNLADLNYKKNKTTNKDVKEALGIEIKEAEQDLKNYIIEKRKITDILNEDQKQELIDIIDQKDNIKSKVESLKQQLEKGELSNKEFGYAIRSLNNQDKRLTEQIEVINATAKEQLLQTGLEATKEESERLGVEQREFETKEEYASLFGKEGTKEYNEALEADGHISEDGKTFFVNREIAAQEGAIAVGSHELLHAIIGKSFSKLKPEAQRKLNENFLNLLSKRDKETVLNRLANSYGITGDKVFTTEELYTAFSDEIVDGGVKFSKNPFGKIANAFEEILRQLSSAGYFSKDGKTSFLYRKEFGNARQAYNFIKDYSLTIKKTGKVTERAKEFAKEDPGRDEEAFSKTTAPETLVKTIKRGRNPKQVKAAEDALVPQYQALALEALGYKEEKGDILRENVVSAVNEYYEAIVRNYDPKKGAFSTHVYNNIAPKNDTIFEKAKTLAKRDESISIDTKEAQEVAGDAGTTTNLEDTFVQKINILKDFAITDRVANKIKALVKVAEGDTFKQVISKYAGKVGELIFGIPAKKIMDGEANLIPTTKYKDGMPIPAEAQNIQRFFNAGENMSKFIKSLPLYNVADKTADIDKIGENIETPRNVFGVAIGLKGLPLDYFYENYIDPRSTSKDAKVRAESITSPKGRSKGLTTQTQVKILKPEFRKPTSETIEKAKRDIGITPKNEPNIYNRDIGQLQKGFAKVYSINASLSGGQRFLADKLAKAPAEKKPAIKKQIAGVTAAQGKAAFSKSVNKVEKLINMRSRLEIDDATFRDKLLELNGLPPTIRVKKEADIDTFIDNLKTNIFPLLPKDAWFGPGKGTAFTSSSKNLGMSSKDPLWVKFKERIQKLKNDDTIKYGKKIDGVKNEDIWSLRNKYTKLFATPEKIRKNIKNGEIEKFNKNVGAIHKAIWERINKAVRKDKKVASGMATYLGFVANDTGHWHKMGAQFAGYSKQLTKRKKGKTKVEYEHAMPATSAYLYLLDAAINKEINFDAAYEMIVDNYKLIALDKAMDDKLRNARTKKGHSLMKRMPDDWSVIENMWYERYFNEIVSEQEGGIDPKSIIGLDGKTFAKKFNINADGNARVLKTGINKNKRFSKSINFSRSTNNESKGITVLDFDDTLATTKSLVKFTRPDGTTGTLNAEEYASTYEDLLDQGYTFDFSDFNKVVKGKLAPLFNKAMKLQGKFGPENMFVLTARPPAAQKAIFDFLKANGLNIPLKNITGLGNSTAEAKALWIADKVGEGYNDFYFADDALQNVQAVKNMLDQFDVKSKVQQAKVKFSKSMNDNFNDILENVTGIEAKKRFSAVKARKRGASKGKFRFFIPPSHEDFVGLLYNFIGKGKEGNKHRDFFEESLIKPLLRADRELNTARQSIANDYRSLNKQFKNVKKKLNKKTPDGDFTYQDAIRVYLWNKHGYDIPGLTPTDQQNLVDLVKSDPELQNYAETLNIISKREDYVKPSEGWEVTDIRMDLDDATGRIGRKEFFAEFLENAGIIFSPENLNKIEAALGPDMVSALKDMLYRIENGRNRPSGSNKIVNGFMNWFNASVAATMFINVRSVVLQQMSLVNFINYSDNNIFAAAKAFANQKQYWTDWATLFNSDFMKQRRGGIMTDVNGAELAESLRGAKNNPVVLLGKLLQMGFKPTQIGDNVAIATGGATYYRNRINTYLKQGLSQKEAEAKAFVDFQGLAEATQQSAKPWMVSAQQSAVLGKIILAFQNVTSQFNRLGKKAFLDIKNRRISPEYKNASNPQLQSDMSNLSRIAYYFAIQNLIFYTLQSALFMAMFDDDEDDKQLLRKKERVIHGSIDSVLRGTGVWGAVVATLKNMAIKRFENEGKDWRANEYSVMAEALQVSPPLGARTRKLVKAERELIWDKKVIKEMETFDIENPLWPAVTNYIEGTTNAPLNRTYNLTLQAKDGLDNQFSALQRVLRLGGWGRWDVGIEGIKKSKKKEKSGSKKKTKKKEFKRKFIR